MGMDMDNEHGALMSRAARGVKAGFGVSGSEFIQFRIYSLLYGGGRDNVCHIGVKH
jgi:hypothetical protein